MDEPRKQPGHSKYDFVKVKVWLGEHYYILSRFLISRMLTVTKIPYIKAVKIALELKKYFVDREELDISQEFLEEALFRIMYSRGFQEDYICRYKMVTSFFQQKRPLIILLCGVSCTGKSTFAQALASRLNLPNVLQTDIIYELLQLSGHCQAPKPVSHPLEPKQVIAAFQTECRDVRRGIDGDLTKSIRDGKPIIIEGLHLDPGLYLYEFGKYGVAHLLRNSSLSSGVDRQELHQSDCKLLNGPRSHLLVHRTLQRSLSAHEVAFFLQRSSAPSSSSTSLTSFQQKLAGALSSRSFDSSPTAVQRHLDSPSVPFMEQDGILLEEEQSAELSTGRSPASEWLQQFLPCFSSQQLPHLGGPPVSHAAAAQTLHRSVDSKLPADPGLNQQLDAKLGRGQLFHCWRRKPEASPQAAAALSRPRRASFHAGQQMQPLSADPIPLHGPGRPLSSDQLSARPATSHLPFIHRTPDDQSGSIQPQNETTLLQYHVPPIEKREGSLPSARQPPAEAAKLSSNDCISEPHASTTEPDDAVASCPSQKAHVSGSYHPAQPEASELSTITAQSNLQSQLASSETSSNDHSARRLRSEARSAGSKGDHAVISESSSVRPLNSEDASHLHQHLGGLQPEAQQGQVPARHRPASPTGPHGPLFVPIVLTLERRDHEVLLREAASRNLGSSQEADAWVEQALQHSAILQEHLRTYASKSIPILQLTLAGFSSRLDTLHDYLLQCMEAAMSRH
ncbi:hypothetical protein WJX74_004123 [Apatococcus lobatus]|uniref:2-phosphoglycerate kinase n=1 Tax=Apatococcus lobatus TaxID=904363 RepID=A0AAW1RXB3_9CHLO